MELLDKDSSCKSSSEMSGRRATNAPPRFYNVWEILSWRFCVSFSYRLPFPCDFPLAPPMSESDIPSAPSIGWRVGVSASTILLSDYSFSATALTA